MRRILLPMLGFAWIGAAHGQFVASPEPPIELVVEQPALTGMPVWLHVRVQGSCLEHSTPTSPQLEYLWLRSDGAEVNFNGHPAPHTPFTGVEKKQGHYVSGELTCVVYPPQGPIKDYRFALSGNYILDQPGHYTVRWVTGDDDFLNPPPPNSFRSSGDGGVMMRAGDVTSGWLDFNVQASTPQQREKWLVGMLAHPPADENSLIYDYIPSLLAAWRDPRATHRLLDLLCGPSHNVAHAASIALDYDLRAADAAYFAGLVDKGCFSEDFLPRDFVLRQADQLVPVRARLLHTLVAQFNRSLGKSPLPHDELASSLAALAIVRNDIPSFRADQEANAWADEQVVKAAPLILALKLTGTRDYLDGPRDNLAFYFSHAGLAPDAHQLLRGMVTERMTGDRRAFAAPVALHDPNDDDLIGHQIVNWPGIPGGTETDDIGTIAAAQGPRALPMLRLVATQSKDFSLRDKAAAELLALRQQDGTSTLPQSAQSTYFLQRRDAMRQLDDLVKRHVALGALSHYCTGPEPDDPCRAWEIHPPPGECEPGFACRPTPGNGHHP